jgi:hypothetical protein
LEQLLAVVALRQPFAACYRQLKRQRGWLVELDRRLDPSDVEGQPRPTGSQVKRHVKEFLAQLAHHAQACPQDAKVVAQICASFRQRWGRLFKCYAWPERYRTNNDLETFFGRLRTRQRQIQGRKSVHEFVLRYGAWAVFLDPTESHAQVLQRGRQFDQAQVDQEQARFRKAQHRLQVLSRFRHRPRHCLKEVEQQWAAALGSQS